MGFQKGQNFNHSVKGAAIKVDPIRRKKDIELIKFNLKDKPRDLCLFTFGINMAFRASELLSLTVEQVKAFRSGDLLGLKESKTRLNSFCKFELCTSRSTLVILAICTQ